MSWTGPGPITRSSTSRRWPPGQTDGDTWRVAGGTFRNIVLPGVTMLDGDLAGLAEFARDGGTVVAAGTVPRLFTGPDQDGGAAFTAAVDDGLITTAGSASSVPSRLRRGPVAAQADVPSMLRRHGDSLVLLLVAHDGQSGTTVPLVPGHSHEDRIAGRFTWRGYWQGRANEGYQFVPVGDRVAHVTVTGAPGARAQRWDPRTGARTDVPARERAGGVIELDVPFEDGPISVVVLSAGLPPATRPPRVTWCLAPSSTATGRSRPARRWTTGGATSETGRSRARCPSRSGTWSTPGASHRPATGSANAPATGPTAAAEPPSGTGLASALATFGPYVQVRGPQAACDGPSGPGAPGWRPGEFSLSRGIRKDPIHFDNLGPKGSVPEEFLLWPDVDAGEWVAVRAVLDLPAGDEQTLVVGADAERRVFLDGQPVPVTGAGYWTESPVRGGPGPVETEIWLARPAGDRPAG